jgi:hypothetical protein
MFGLRVPFDLIGRLLNDRILFRPTDEEQVYRCSYYLYSLKKPLTMELTIDERRFEFATELISAGFNETHGCTRIEIWKDRAGERRHYTDTANWALGRFIVSHAFCYGLDYERGLLGLANLIAMDAK